jgi:hypothetical protein
VTPAGHALARRTWRQWGFDLTDEQIEEVEDFFDRWHPTYQLPGVDAYRSQEALFASSNGLARLFGEGLSRREQRSGANASRAGYCVGLVEKELGFRAQPDPGLQELLRRKEHDDKSLAAAHAEGRERKVAAAVVRSQHFSEAVTETILERPEVGRGIEGFPLREAVFAELRHTLFAKLKITGLPSSLDSERADIALRYGHAIAVCEEALPVSSPVVSRLRS